MAAVGLIVARIDIDDQFVVFSWNHCCFDRQGVLARLLGGLPASERRDWIRSLRIRNQHLQLIQSGAQIALFCRTPTLNQVARLHCQNLVLVRLINDFWLRRVEINLLTQIFVILHALQEPFLYV